jgi:hypothetical protein
VSWGAHQFEIYAVHAHLPRKMRGQVSFFGIWLGDFTPDFLAKFWVYGVTIGGTRYGASVPERWHRGWPGMGLTHTVFTGALLAALLWAWRRSRGLTMGYLLGYAAHALTDVNDSVGTMLLFPFSTLNWTVRTWAYAATVGGGKYLDARVLQQPRPGDGPLLARGGAASWRVLTADYWRREVVPADARGWAALGRVLPERALLALYRPTFFYGLCRMVAWTAWAHLLARPVIDGVRRQGYPFDLSWTGPWWMPQATLPHVPVLLVPVGVAVLLAAVYGVAGWLWEPMGAAERRAADRAAA